MKTRSAKLLMALLVGIGALTMAQAQADESKKSDSHAAPVSCSTQVSNTCGVPVVVSTCTGSGVADREDDHDEGLEADDHHDTHAPDSHGNDDKHRVSRDHSDHGDKISICHRMGGHEVDLTVANDGYAHGHSGHDMDTVGRCSDFDSEKDDDSDRLISVADSAKSVRVTPKVISCMKAPVSAGGLGCNAAGTSCMISTTGGQAPTRGGSRALR